ncbi:uncharacterized protein LOC130096544 isoform X2 [Rhinichthys klamathensis goyatoka]|uniref:uncharacterized protein LOC130096544 isoform X2 n=1 Tax=Rhinichthys klamathensis goyatoka TaxID=3034132 RepID=UPI0024B5FA93|nr:uncharacterized protein LOC130096544 isoform X2 [Rhinichthys klamathensis goyatoka]
MIQLLNLLSLTAKLSNADISVSLGVITLSGWNDLTCCGLDQAIPQCVFYAESRNIGHRNSSEHCCKLTVSGEELLLGKAGKELQTTIIVHCKSKPEDKMSQNFTITVWRLSLFHFVFLVLGTLILLSLLIFIIVFICILYMTKKQGYRQNQSANSVEVQAEKTEIVEDELLYATVNHSGASEKFAAVKYESGTDYATVVIH